MLINQIFCVWLIKNYDSVLNCVNVKLIYKKIIFYENIVKQPVDAYSSFSRQAK